MDPQVATFFQHLDENKRKQAEQPTQEQVFAEQQFSTVVDAISATEKAMKKFLTTYSPETTVKNFPTSIKTPDVSAVVLAVKALEKALKPIKPDDSKVIAQLQAVLEQLKALKLDPVVVPAPTVNIPAPNVKVDAPDLTSLTKAIKANKPEKVDNSKLLSLLRDNLKATKAVSKAVQEKSIPVANTPTDPLINYLPADVDDAGTVQYFGYTDNHGAWFIRKYDTSVSPKTLRFCFGQSNYATNFSNRGALTYTVWGS